MMRTEKTRIVPDRVTAEITAMILGYLAGREFGCPSLGMAIGFGVGLLYCLLSTMTERIS